MSIVVLLVPALASAAWPTDPTVNVPVCTAAYNQYGPRVVPDGVGGAIIAWKDFRNGTHYDIYAQRLSMNGEAMWAANGVPICTAAGEQAGAGIVPDGEGGAIITWSDTRAGNSDIYAQRVSPAGVVQWAPNGVALCSAAGDQLYPGPLADGSGGAFVKWLDQSTGSDVTYAQRISHAGDVQWTAGGLPLVNAQVGMVRDGAGGVIIGWIQSNLVHVRGLSGAGATQWTANEQTVASYGTMGMIPDGAGGAIVFWSDYRNAVPPWYTGFVYTQRFTGAGSVTWTAGGVPVAPVIQSAASDGTGGIMFFWSDGSDLRAQRVNGAGGLAWSPDLPVCTAIGEQLGPNAMPDGAGNVIVAWADKRNTIGTTWRDDLYIQKLSADGTELWTPGGVPLCTNDSDQEVAWLAPDMAGGAIAVWEEVFRIKPNYYDLFAQNISATGVVGGVHPTPVLVSLVVAEVVRDHVNLAWSASGPVGGAILQRCYPGGQWVALAELLADGSGYLRYEDPLAPSVTRVGYRLEVADALGAVHLGETWVDVPRAGLALSGPSPNPSDGRSLTVRFTLAGDAPARLQLMDVTGRCVAERALAGGGSGSIDLGSGHRLAPGLYLVRLSQGSSVRTTRVAVVP